MAATAVEGSDRNDALKKEYLGFARQKQELLVKILSMRQEQRTSCGTLSRASRLNEASSYAYAHFVRPSPPMRNLKPSLSLNLWANFLLRIPSLFMP